MILLMHGVTMILLMHGVTMILLMHGVTMILLMHGVTMNLKSTLYKRLKRHKIKITLLNFYTT